MRLLGFYVVAPVVCWRVIDGGPVCARAFVGACMSVRVCALLVCGGLSAGWVCRAGVCVFDLVLRVWPCCVFVCCRSCVRGVSVRVVWCRFEKNVFLYIRSPPPPHVKCFLQIHLLFPLYFLFWSSPPCTRTT